MREILKKENLKKAIKKSSIVLLLGTLVFGGGVFAKYVASNNGNGSMQVAKWNVEFGEIELSNTNYTAATLAEGKIAPGTSGSFNVSMDATGTQTAIDYTVTFNNVTNVPKNMYFVVDNTEYATLAEVGQALSGHFNANDSSKSLNKTVQWKWDYETTTSKDGLRTTLVANDAQDTIDGEAALTMSFNVVVTATQSPVTAVQ